VTRNDRYLDSPGISVLAADVTALFNDFLAFSVEWRNQLTAVRNARLGYKHGYQREHKKDSYDSEKDIFHFTPGCVELFDSKLVSNPQVSRLLNACQSLFSTAEPLIVAALENMLEEEGVNPSYLLGKSTFLSSALRIVGYDPVDVGSYLIPPHYDQGSVTIGIYDSSPGLRLYDEAGPYLADLDGEAMLLLTGLNLEVESAEQCLPTWHDVIQTVESVRRYSILLFVDAVEPRVFPPQIRYQRRKRADATIEPLRSGDWSL
jgi:hypothetical protein